MENLFGTHRYRSLNSELKEIFGEPVYKLSLDLNLGCPNVDGTVGCDGCIFCNTKANIPTTQKAKPLSLDEQIRKGAEYLKKRYSNVQKYIAYFQNHTNTHATPEKLREWFLLPLKFPDVVGISISTRPDAVSEEIFEIFRELSKKTYLWIEYGLSSANDKTLSFIKRGHTVKQFEDAAIRTQSLGIPVCAHVILGLPGETHEDMMRTSDFLNKVGIAGVKVHNLFVLKNTELERLYLDGRYKPMTLEEYAALACDFIERLDPKIIIHRFNSHGPKDLTVAPDWSVNKIVTYNAVEAELKRRDTYQGCLFRQDYRD